MAQKLVIDIDYNITEAEAKQRKLIAQWEQQKIKVDQQKQKVAELNAKLREQKDILEYRRQKISSKEDITVREAEAFEKLEADVKKATNEYEKQNALLGTEKAKLDAMGTSVKNVGNAQKESNKQTKKGSGFMDSFSKRVKGLAKRIFIFSLISKAFRGLLNYTKEYIAKDEKMGKAVSQLKGNLQVIGTTLMESLRPAIQVLLDLAVKFTSAFGSALASILGKDVNQMKALAKATKKSGEEAKKATASFDTLQTIDTSSDNESDSTVDVSGMGSFTDIELAKFGTLSGFALIGLGLLLIAFGQLPLGIMCASLGVLMVYGSAKENPNAVKELLQGTFGKVLAIVGGALLVLGIILCCFGQVPLGVACIVAGIGSLGITAWANSDSILKKIKEIWQSIKDWWNRDVAPIFSGEFWKTVFSGIKIGLKWVLNLCIDIVNKFIKFINDTIQLALVPIKIISYITGMNIDFKKVAIPTIPKLATGAVIPGGSPFLAMLGDQRKGQTNIEAPLDTIVQAFIQAQGSQNLTLTIDGNMSTFVKAMNPVLKRENKRSSVF